MDELRNPYAPGAGVQPPELTGRAEFIRSAEVTIGRATKGLHCKSFIAIGLRGVGKTVLLNRIRTMAESASCRVAMIEAHDDKSLPALLIPDIRRVLFELDRLGAVCEKAKAALRAFRSFLGSVKLSYGDLELSLGVEPLPGVADSGDLEADLPALFCAIGAAAKARNVVVVLILDEIQYLSEKELSALVMAMHKVAQDQLPVILIGAGLPLLVGKMGESKSYAERLFDFPEIGALRAEDAARAISEPARREGITFADEALAEIFSLTKGYPYFLQQWAYVCWNKANRSPITDVDVRTATPEVIGSLDTSFFRVRFDRLTPREKQYLRAMADIGPGPHKSGDIAAKLGVPSNMLGPCRSKLISKGMIYSPAYGDTAFTVPLFDQYMKRVMGFTQWRDD